MQCADASLPRPEAIIYGGVGCIGDSRGVCADAGPE